MNMNKSYLYSHMEKFQRHDAIHTEYLQYDSHYIIKFKSKENHSVELGARPEFSWGGKQGADTGRRCDQRCLGDSSILFPDLS